MEVAGRVAGDDAAERLGGGHDPLDRPRLAPVEVEAFGVGIETFLIGVELVGGEDAQAVLDHAVFVDRLVQRAQRRVDLVRVDAHQREAGPLLGEVGVVGDAAPEVTIGHLALVDPPVHEMAGELQILELSERPERHARGRLWLGEGRHVLGAVVDVRPVAPCLRMIGIDAQQVGNVGEDATIEAGVLGGGVLLDQEAPIVLHLVEAVGDMLLGRLGAFLEDEAQPGAVERVGGEVRGRGRDREV